MSGSKSYYSISAGMLSGGCGTAVPGNNRVVKNLYNNFRKIAGCFSRYNV
jgi:hypothetical protein